MTRRAHTSKIDEVITPYDEALVIAKEAWEKWPAIAAAEARRDWVKPKLTVDMLWSVIDAWQFRTGENALRHLLDEAAKNIREQNEEVRKIQRKVSKVVTWAAPADKPHVMAHWRRIEEEDALRRAKSEVRAALDNAVGWLGDFDYSDPGYTVAREVEAHAKAVGAKVADAVKSAETQRLYTFLLDGKPLAEHTAREALAWCERQERDVEFVRGLCAGVPLDDTLGRWYGAAPLDVEAIWKRVNSEEFTLKRKDYRSAFDKEWARACDLASQIGKPGEDIVDLTVAQIRNARQVAAWKQGEQHLKDWPDPFVKPETGVTPDA